MRLHAIAPAKLNLSLYLTGKRADGYHLLDSLVAFTQFGDELSLSPADDLSLEVTGEYAGQVPVADNLILKAVALVRAHYDVVAGAQVLLHKHIPVGAGLGGGSSDAAMATMLVCKLWDIPYDAAMIGQLLAPLGADMAACITRKPLWMRGVGEVIEPAQGVPDYAVLLVNPRVVLPTPDVYGALQPEEIGRAYPQAEEDMAAYILQARNDLQAAAIRLCPVIDEVLGALARETHCVVARQSGSGATCFALFDKKEAALEAASVIANAYPTWWVMPTQLLGT